ncbi:hypothetical protein C3L33_15931, partial [Rhododendron williamsianum]
MDDLRGGNFISPLGIAVERRRWRCMVPLELGTENMVAREVNFRKASGIGAGAHERDRDRDNECMPKRLISSSNNSKKHETECFDIPKQLPPRVKGNGAEVGRDAKIVKKLTVVGLWCIQWCPGGRPSMEAVVQMLEGDGKTLAMPPNPFSTTNPSVTMGSIDGRPSSSVLDIISESESN